MRRLPHEIGSDRQERQTDSGVALRRRINSALQQHARVDHTRALTPLHPPGLALSLATLLAPTVQRAALSGPAIAWNTTGERYASGGEWTLAGLAGRLAVMMETALRGINGTVGW